MQEFFFYVVAVVLASLWPIDKFVPASWGYFPFSDISDRASGLFSVIGALMLVCLIF